MLDSAHTTAVASGHVSVISTDAVAESRGAAPLFRGICRDLVLRTASPAGT
jgi:hypothetical protein